MKKIIILLLSASLLFSLDIRLDKAIAMSKDPTKQQEAADKLLELSLEGNTKAMTEMGRLFIYGKGMPRNCKKGTYFLINALSKTDINNPDPEAMKELALMFKRGLCVKKDKKKYDKYMKKYFKYEEKYGDKEK